MTHIIPASLLLLLIAAGAWYGSWFTEAVADFGLIHASFAVR